MLELTFNPGLTLTIFRTTRPSLFILLPTTGGSMVRSACPWRHIRFLCKLTGWSARQRGKNMAEFLAPLKINPVWKDMLYVEMLWIAHVRKSVKLKQELVQKLQKIVACVQDSRHKGYFCNDRHKSLRRKNSSELAEILHPDPEWLNARNLSTETRNYKPMSHLQPISVARHL